MRRLTLGVAVAAMLTPAVPAQALPATGPARVIVMRPGYAELFSDRRMQRVVYLPRGPVNMDMLVRSIGDPSWASMSRNGVLTLKAGVNQRPGTELHVKHPVRTVRLADSAYLAGTRAKVLFAGVTVTSAATRKRPYVRYLNRSTLVATKTTFHGLGTPSTEYRGVTVGSGGTVVAADTVFRAGGRGLDAYRAARVSLTRVSATRNADSGVVVNQAGSLALKDVFTTGNGGSGLVLRGPLPVRRFAGTIRSTGNHTGVELSGLGAAAIGPLRTDRNGKAGLVLDRCPGCVVTGLTATDEGTAVLVESHSPMSIVADSSIERATLAGVRTAAPGVRLYRVRASLAPSGVGVRIPRGVPDVRVESSVLSGGAVAVSTDGSRTAVSDVSVTGSRIGVRVGGNADRTAVTHVRTVDTKLGLVANSGSREVTVSGLAVSQRGGRGIKSAAERLSVTASAISGSDIGLDVKGRAAVTASSVTGADEGVHAGEHGRLVLTNAVLRASVLGLRTAASSYVVINNSTVDAPRGAKGPVELRGDTRFPAMPTRWIGIFVLVILAAGIALEAVRRLRERRHDRTTAAPPHVTNTT